VPEIISTTVFFWKEYTVGEIDYEIKTNMPLVYCQHPSLVQIYMWISLLNFHINP